MRSLWTLFAISLFFIHCSSPAESPAAPESLPTIVSAGDSIAYDVCGNADTTLLFVHGWNINRQYWSGQIPVFCKNYKVVSIDLPGHGDSGRSRTNWTVEQFGADVAQVMKTLKLKNVILIGHSMGGDIILEAAHKAPEAVIGCIGIDNFKEFNLEGYSEEDSIGMVQFIAGARADYRGVMGAYSEASLFSAQTDSLVRRRVMNDVLQASPEIAVSIIEDLVWYTKKEPQRLSTLPVKLVLVNSDPTPTDTITLAKLCQHGYAVFPVDGTGHYPMIEAPEEFNRQLQKAVAQF